jgi:hypothetical protein
MAYETLKSIITQNIKTNGQESITGIVLQQILLRMVDELGYTPEGDLATKEWVNTQLSDYASQAWVNNKLGDYLPLAGGTLTGSLFFSSDGINRGEIFGDEYGLNIQVAGQGKLLVENAIETDSTIKTDGFIKIGGTSSQVLCADGSVKTLAELKAALNAI